MTHLNIQQGLNIEVVSTNLIKKLYEAALSVSEPLEEELDAAYMSGNLLVAKTYRSLVEYLTNRFDDLHINVTDSYYIPFEDSAVLNVLLANNIGDGIGVTEAEAANATLTNSTFKGNTDITSFNTFKYFTKANTNPPGNLFWNCTNLTSIDLSNVTTCSGSEFRNSGLSGEISLPNLTGNVARWSFSGTNITSVTNLGTVIGISSDAGGSGYLDGAFSYCKNLTSVTIPSTVTAISGAFLGCSKLTTINGDLTNVLTLGNSSFSSTKISSLPNTPNVLTIGNTCFSSCTLMTGVLNYPNLTSIGLEAFKETAITSILNLGSITSIPLDCFRSCTSLTSVTLPSTVTSLGNNVFLNCTGITSIDLTGSTITSIPTNCFYGCTSLTSFTDFSNITSIGGAAFCDTKITGDLSIPNLTGTLKNNAFRNTNITSISGLGSITAISPTARYGYGEGAFHGCKMLTTVTLPSTLTSISSGFDGCTSLTTVNGNLLNLTSLTLSAFSGTKISSIPNMTGLLTIGSDVFFNCSLLSVAVNCPNLTLLGNRAFWSSGITSVVNLGTITSIPKECFRGCSSLTSVILPNTCFTLVDNCFSWCTSLATIDVSNIKNISGYEVFANTAITRLDLPAIETISQRGLSGCHNCSIVDLGPNLSSIGNLAFWDSAYTTFIFRGTTVPTFNAPYSDKFLYNMNNVTIYVPESALSDYQTAWPQMASNMVKIEGSVYDTQS